MVDIIYQNFILVSLTYHYIKFDEVCKKRALYNTYIHLITYVLGTYTYRSTIMG